MKKTFSGSLLAVTTLCLLLLNTVLFFIPILLMGLLKLFPSTRWRVLCTRIIDKLANGWTFANNFYMDRVYQVQWEISGFSRLDKNSWYLLVANHQSWLDIVVLQYVFTGKIPVLKFFIKDQLKWVPLMGFAWWAMGCPFMKRYSKEYLAKNPHRKGKDLKATRKAMEMFQHTPSTIINFIEGTRFTLEKKQEQGSTYQYLLKPRAGGIEFVINAMRDKINTLLDVTIVYSSDNPSLWDFLCHRIDKVTINIREIVIPEFYLQEQTDSNSFRQWLNERWLEKDSVIAKLKLK